MTGAAILPGASPRPCARIFVAGNNYSFIYSFVIVLS